MLTPIAVIDKQNARINVGIVKWTYALLCRLWIIKLLILNGCKRITFEVYIPQFFDIITDNNVAIKIERLVARKNVWGKVSVIY